MKNINLLLASSAAFLGLFVGLNGSDIAKLGYAIGATSVTGFTAGSVLSRNKAGQLKHDADKLVSIARIDKDKAIASARYETNRSEGLQSQILTLNEEKLKIQSDLQKLSESLQNALKQASINRAAVSELSTRLSDVEADKETLETEKTALVAELEETLEDMHHATERIDSIVTIKLSELTESVHEAYKIRLMANVDKLAIGMFNAKAKNLVTQIEIVSAENDNLKKELDRYETEFGEVQAALNEDGDEFDFSAYMGSTVEAYTLRITELNTKIEGLQYQLAESQAPQYFIGSNRDFEPGNKIIKFVWESRAVALDGAWRAVSGTTETFYFQLRKTADIKPARECINSNLDDIRIATGCKQVAPSEWDSEKALLKFTCVNHVQMPNKNAIEALWIPAHKFPSLVGNWQRIRITGASEGAKSPLARNILGAKLLNGEKFEIVRFDPSGGSRKDYWRVAPHSTDFEDLPEILNQMGNDATEESRKLSKSKILKMYILDETDICFSRVKNPDSMGVAIKEVGKHGSHTAVGCILAGQNANVTSYRGLQRSDFNSFVNIHIGANIFDALVNSNHATGTTQMMADARILIDYCDGENKDREIENRLQVALVEETGKRYFIQLPKLGEYGFDKAQPGNEYDFKSGFSTSNYPPNLRSLNQALIEGVAVSNQVKDSDPYFSHVPPKSTPHPPHPKPETLAQVDPRNGVGLPVTPPVGATPKCPHCYSEKLRTKDKTRYECKACKKSFVKHKAAN